MKCYYVVTHYQGTHRKSASPFKTRKAAERWIRICQASAPKPLTAEIIVEEA